MGNKSLIVATSHTKTVDHVASFSKSKTCLGIKQQKKKNEELEFKDFQECESEIIQSKNVTEDLQNGDVTSNEEEKAEFKEETMRIGPQTAVVDEQPPE